MEAVKSDVEFLEDRVLVELRSDQVIIGKRTDVEEQNVKGRVFIGKPLGQFSAALLFVVEERLIPLFNGL